MRPGDNKWTMTIMARNPDNGMMKWGYQKTPHDEWDYAGVNVMMLTDQKIDGKDLKLVTHPDRNGILYTLNRENGDLIRADFLDDTVNVWTHVDMKTGIPVRNPEYRHSDGHITPRMFARPPWAITIRLVTPTTRSVGCSTWRSTTSAWIGSPSCFRTAPASSSSVPPCRCIPGPKGDRASYLGLGQVKAYSAPEGKYKWSVMERFAAWGGTLATAGGVMFYPTLDGYFKARNSDTGELLWKFKMPSGGIGYPMTYEHNGTQYIGIHYGVGGWPGVGLVFDLQDPTAGLGAVGAFRNLQNWTQMGGGLLVFSLNGKSPYTEDVNLDEYSTEIVTDGT